MMNDRQVVHPVTPDIVNSLAHVSPNSLSLLVVVAAVDSADAPLLLPYKTLLSTVSSMTFSEGEAQRLIKVLSDKAGLDSWQLVQYFLPE
jgi:hypothetical protein